MQQTRDDELDDILSRWHHWQQSQRTSPARGYNSRSAGFESWRASRQWDDENGALDGDFENETMKRVDFQVREMAEPYRSAIHAAARALSLGVTVFTSPRLPADRTERQAVIARARQMLADRLAMCGVM